jgi:hypothetical protein
VVTVAADDSAQMLSPPGGAFLEIRLNLCDLERHQAVELLARRPAGCPRCEMW